MVDRRLKQALKPLVAKISRESTGGEDALRIDKNGTSIKIPFSQTPIDSSTNTLE